MTIHCKWRNCYTVSRHQLTFVRLTVMSQKQHITFSVCQWADDIMVIRNMASLCATPGWLNMHCTTLHSCTVVTLPESSNGPVSVTVTNSVSVCPLLTPNDRATGHPVKVGSWLGLHSVMTSHTHTIPSYTAWTHTVVAIIKLDFLTGQVCTVLQESKLLCWSSSKPSSTCCCKHR